MYRGCLLAAGLLGLGMAYPVQADVEPLPEPMTLSHALSLADAPHPELDLDVAELQRRAAGGELASAGSDLDISLQGRVAWVEPSSVTASDSHDGSRVSLVLKKRLYDFGRTEAAVRASHASVEGQKARLFARRQQRRLDILEQYLEVVMTDLHYLRDNEAMAIAFIRYDDGRDRHELGKLSDVDLLRLESNYLKARSARARSEALQRLSRSRLAMALNRPGELSSDVQRPVLKGNRRERPELVKLEQQMLQDNPLLRALRHEVQAAQARVEEASAGGRPVVDGIVEASSYARKTSSADPWRGGVHFTAPLYRGDRVRAQTAERRAELVAAAGELARTELELRQQLLELWLELGTLQQQSEEAEINQAFSEISLDRSRALYELEKNSNFGDAQVGTSAARLQVAETEFQIARVWARLDALVGVEPEKISMNLLQGVQP